MTGDATTREKMDDIGCEDWLTRGDNWLDHALLDTPPMGRPNLPKPLTPKVKSPEKALFMVGKRINCLGDLVFDRVVDLDKLCARVATLEKEVATLKDLKRDTQIPETTQSNGT